jgi:1,4-alpha-glucan branching enzyme
VSLIRRGHQPGECIVGVFNWTPIVRTAYRVGVPQAGYYRELLNSDALSYGGSNVGIFGGLDAEAVRSHNHPYSLNLTVPPLGALFLKVGS